MSYQFIIFSAKHCWVGPLQLQSIEPNSTSSQFESEEFLTPMLQNKIDLFCLSSYSHAQGCTCTQQPEIHPEGSHSFTLYTEICDKIKNKDPVNRHTASECSHTARSVTASPRSSSESSIMVTLESVLLLQQWTNMITGPVIWLMILIVTCLLQPLYQCIFFCQALSCF